MLQVRSSVVSIHSRSRSPLSCSEAKQLNLTYVNLVIGAATFDLNGLPKEYFVTSKSVNGNWTQASFQALGLQSLLASSLQLEGFCHAIIHGEDRQVLVVRQPSNYLAVLLQADAVVSSDFIRWAQNFELALLKSESRFTQV